MNFNSIVNSVLSEWEQHPITHIPALDGKREYYCLHVFENTMRTYASRYASPLTVGDLFRIPSGQEGLSIDEPELLHTGSSFSQAFDVFVECFEYIGGDLVSKAISQQSYKDDVIDRCMSTLKPAIDVIGVWSVYLSESSVTICVDVDMDAYNTAKQAAEDLKDF